MLNEITGNEVKLEFRDGSYAKLSVKDQTLHYSRQTIAGDALYTTQFLLTQRVFANAYSQTQPSSVPLNYGSPKQSIRPFPLKPTFVKFTGTGSGNIWKTFVLENSCYVHTVINGLDYYVLIDLLTGKMIHQSPKVFNDVLAALKAQPVHRAAHDLSEIRKMKDDADFKIACRDGISIPVHSLVMKTYWPFFRAMMNLDSVEKREMVLNLDFPSNWVEVLVSYIYGEPVEMDFEQATGVCVLGDMYQLPELAELATQVVTTVPSGSITLEEALAGWQNGHGARNERVKAFLAKEVALKQKGQENKLGDLSVEEMRELYMDTLKISTVE